MKKTLNMKFMEELSRCRDVMTFVGLLRMFDVPFVEKKENEEGAEEVCDRDFNTVFKELMAKYSASDRKIKRNVLKMLKDANNSAPLKEEGEEDAGSTENQEETV